MTLIIKYLGTRSMKWALAAATGIGSLAIPSLAKAADHDGFRGYGGHDRFEHHDGGSRVGFGFGFASPGAVVYEDQSERFWCEPVYRTVYDRVWCEPVVKHVNERVWIEPIYADRDVVRYEDGRRVICRERMLVTAGHYEDRVQVVTITEGHWDTAARQEAVSPGHWEYRSAPVAVEQKPAWNFSFGFRGH